MTREQVIEKLKRRQGKKSLRTLAKELGISAAYLSDVYRGRRDPGPKLLVCFGLIARRTTTVRYE